jgi:hypothetical protein
MASTNKTAGLGLNQWLGADSPKREDFNADNLIIDSAFDNVLQKDNETPFTPSGIYQPATKSYVDNKVFETGAADMTQAIYDQDSNGIVDNAERLGGQLPEYYDRKVAFVGSDSADNYAGWYKVAEQTCTNNGNANIVFAVAETFSYNGARRNRGILELGIRSNSTNGNITCEMLRWSTRIGFNVSDFIVVINAMTWTLYAKSTTRYSRICFEVLSLNSTSSRDLAWPLTFQDNTTPEATAPTPTVISSDGDFFVHSKSGTVHALTGILPTSGTCELTFKASAGYTYGDTFTLNNTAYSSQTINGEALSEGHFVSGAIITKIGVDVTNHILWFN